MTLASAIYEGEVRHRRTAEAAHAFSYRITHVYLDLAEADAVCALSPLWSQRRFAPAWLRRRDFLPQRGGTLREAVLAEVAALGGDAAAIGPVRMLAQLRWWGYLHNPIVLYYCFATDGSTLLHLLAEVHNTPWNERHCYLVKVDGETLHRDRNEKVFHVSPFLPREMEYHWQFNTPGERLTLHLENHRDGQRAFDATLSLTRQEIGAARLTLLPLRQPFLTLKTAVGIYWQALRLWRKGVTFFPNRSATVAVPAQQPETTTTRSTP